MKKKLSFEEVVDSPIEKVWKVLQDPSSIVVERNVKVDKDDDLHWIEHCNASVYNQSTAELDSVAHTLTVHTINSKYKSETNDIVLHLQEIGEQTKLTVDYTVGTTAIFNIITMEVLGEKIMHHASNTVVKNIKHKLK